MKLVPFTTPNHRPVTSSDRGTIITLDRQTVRRLTTVEQRNASPRATPRPLQLGHVHLKVRALDRSVPFYIRMLRLRLTERVGRHAFLAIGDEHHSVALEEIGTGSVEPSRRAVGVAHVAFQAPDRAAFAAVRERLRRADWAFQSRDNGISWAVRFKDPDGNEIEIYVDRRRSPGGTPLWGGRWHGPLQCESEPAPLIAAAEA